MTKNSSIKLNDPKVINGWALFDCANSAYSLTIAVAIFPAYFEEKTPHVVSPFGIEMYNTTLFAIAVALSYLLIACISPLLSGIADYSGRKKFFLKFFTTLGSLACMSLFYFDGNGDLAIGTLGFILATVGFAGSLVFYNSYLPDIVTEDMYNRVSAKGFAMGYGGSVLLLIFNLLVILNPGWFGIPDDSTVAARLAFLTVGLWWLGFAQISFRRLPKDTNGAFSTSLLTKGFDEFKRVWRSVMKSRNIKYFLLSFFCFSAGVQTVLSLASLFAKVEMKMETSELIIVIILLQVVGLLGAYLFAKLSDRIGNKAGLLIMLALWTVVCIAGFFVADKGQFYVMAACVGLVMGGVQSQSRATYSMLLPEKTPDTTSYFSFYDVLEKAATALGSFSFAFTGQLSGGMRYSVLALAVFFLAGLLILTTVQIKHIKNNSH
jgi:UMF1 family MFS transporter